MMYSTSRNARMDSAKLMTPAQGFSHENSTASHSACSSTAGRMVSTRLMILFMRSPPG